MKRKKALRLSFDYMDTSERRVLSLVPDGVPCVPVLGFDAYRCQWRAAPVERKVRIRSAVTELLLALVEAARMTTPLRSAERIAEVIEAMKADLARDWTLEELATRVDCSTSKLLAAFKQHTGAPPHAFLVSCRIARAKELLAADGGTVAAVAAEVGFATPQHFANHFKLATGLTPREWHQTCAKAQVHRV